MRFPAALAVVVLHAFALLDPGPVARFVGPWNSAVTLFFVLSGYVITVGCSHLSAREFYWRRIARLGPLQLVTWCVCVPLMPLLGWPLHPARLVQSGALVECWVPRTTVMCGTVNAPTWSLSAEVLFYALFPLIAARRVSPRWALLLPAAVVVSWWWPGLSVWAPLRLGEFAVGVALARGWKPGWLPAASAASLGGLLGLCAASAAGLVGRVNSVEAGAVALPFAAWTVAALSTRREAPGVRLGEMGYALFMTHFPVVMLFVAAGWVGPAGALCAVCVAVPVGWAAHRFVERPAERRLRQIPAAGLWAKSLVAERAET